MINTKTIPFIPKRKRVQFGAPPPVLGPVLVAAEWGAGGLLQLAFDRAIDPAIDPSQIVVDDEIGDTRWQPNGGVTMVNPNTVRMTMEKNGPPIQPGLHLTATSANGIKSADDEEMWAGVSDLSLPFP